MNKKSLKKALKLVTRIDELNYIVDHSLGGLDISRDKLAGSIRVKDKSKLRVSLLSITQKEIKRLKRKLKAL